MHHTFYRVVSRTFSSNWRNYSSALSVNPLAYTDVPETAGLARSINP